MTAIVFMIDSISPNEWSKIRANVKCHKSKFPYSKYMKTHTRPGPSHLWEIFKGERPNEGPFMFDIVLGEGPYVWLKKFGFLKNRRITRQIVFRISQILNWWKNPFTPMRIPFDLLPNFSRCMGSFEIEKIQNNKANGRNLLNFNNRIKAKYINWNKNKWMNVGDEIKKNDVTIIHFGFLDGIRHMHGPNSDVSGNALGLVTEWINKILDGLGNELEFVIFFSDHSMSEVKNVVDVSEFVNACKSAGIPYFLNSPVIRCWPGKSTKPTNVLKSFETQGYGKLVSSEELKSFQLPINKMFGEYIFWASEGVHFVPDFYMGTQRVKGMHGYFKWDPVPMEYWGNKNPSKAFRKLKGLDNLIDILDSLLSNV